MTRYPRWLRALTAVAAGAALVVSGLLPANASASASEGATSGTVTGALIGVEVHADASIRLCTESAQCVSTRAVRREFTGGSDFAFTDVEPGEYVIGITGARFDEFVDDWWPGVESVADAGRVSVSAGETAHVEWNLRRGASLTGSLSNGATGIVTLSDSQGRELKTSNTLGHVSGDTYSFTGLRPGTYQLTARASGFSVGRTTAEVIGTATVERDIEMTRLGHVVATVTASPYAALDGAVRLFDLDGHEVQANTDIQYRQDPRTGAASGIFRLDDVEPGEYRLLFDLTSGGYPTWYGGTSTSRGATIVTVVSGGFAAVTQPAIERDALPTGSISATILGPDGEPVHGGWVEVYDVDGRKRLDYRTQDGASAAVDGAFEFMDLPAGEYRVLVRDNPSTDTSGRYPYDATWYGGASLDDAATVTVTAGQPSPVVIRLTRTLPAEAVTITGRVRVAGVNAQGAMITAIAAERVDTALWPAVDERTVVAADGTYELRGLRPGAYVLRFDDAASWDVRLATRYASDSATRAGATVISISPGRTRTVDLSFTKRLEASSMAPVRGRVTGSDTKAPLAGVKVRATPRVAYYAPNDIVETRTAADGTFELGIWNSWDYTVTVTGQTPYASRSVVVSPIDNAVVWTSVALTRITTSSAPALPATVRVGTEVKPTLTGWTTGMTFSYQWKRNGKTISGATTSIYKPVPADRGQSLTISVTGKRGGYTTVTRTSAPKVIGYGSLTLPTPGIYGPAEAGAVLRVSRGSAIYGATYSYQWFRNGTAIAGASNSWRTLSSSDVGDRISVKVTVRKPGYWTLTKASAAVGPIAR